jgi:hypothetical protein
MCFVPEGRDLDDDRIRPNAAGSAMSREVRLFGVAHHNHRILVSKAGPAPPDQAEQFSARW